jgi:type II secretory pathway pseudopilin PulG
MSRQPQRALRSEAGFSFVELLVTIIVAGIVFAGVVPVFVAAAKKSSQDNSRNVAANLAQGRLEKIRGLQYDLILDDSTHLNDPGFANGQFAAPYEYDNGVSVKSYWIDYQVDLYPSTATAGKEDYKQVQVRVSWAPSEADITPENSVTLRTIIYKQYAGPTILAPPRIVAPTLEEKTRLDGTIVECVASPNMVIEIDVDPNKLPTTRTVLVGIYSATGELIEQIPEAQVVRYGTQNQWRATWTAPDTVNDGPYVIKAVAVSTSNYLGNNAQTEFQLELGGPDDVTGLTATPGNGVIQLGWTRPTAADLDHYVIYRSSDGSFTAPLESSWTSVGYTDPAAGGPPLANDEPYYYKVVAVDVFGQESAGVVVGPTVPSEGSDVTPPNPPSNLLWTAAGKTITLTWTASPGDANVPPTISGLGDYFLYQAAVASGPWDQVWHGTATTHSVALPDYAQTAYFRVTAKDLVLNESSATNTVAAVSGPAPTFNLAIHNTLTGGNHRYVRVHSGSLTGPLVGTNTGWLKVNAGNTNTANWQGLVVGKYYVEWSTRNSGDSPMSDFFTQLSSGTYTFDITR